MNVGLKRHLPRRTFLRGLGAAIGLPFLDAMHPALAFTEGKPASGLVDNITAGHYREHAEQIRQWRAR